MTSATAAEVAAEMDTALGVLANAAAVGGQVQATDAVRGNQSEIAFVAGTSAAFAAAIGVTIGEAAHGDGNVGNVDAVTVAELAAIATTETGDTLSLASDGSTPAKVTSARYTVIARPYDPVRVPVIFSGSPELAVIAAPRAGDVGILMLAGRSIADALASASAPVLPEFMPNPLRLSDGCYLGHLLAGDSSAPAEGQPAADVAQLGPRDSRAGSVYLRLTRY